MIEPFVFFVQWSPVNQGFHVTEMGELNTQVDGVFSTVFWRRTVFALLFLNIYLYTHIKIDVSSVSNYFTWWIHYDARSPWCFKWVLQTGHSFQIFMTSAEQRNPQIPLFVEFHQAIPVYGAWARGMITGHFGRKMDAGCGFQHAR